MRKEEFPVQVVIKENEFRYPAPVALLGNKERRGKEVEVKRTFRVTLRVFLDLEMTHRKKLEQKKVREQLKTDVFSRRREVQDHDRFRRFYDRGDLPVRIEHGARRRLCWKITPSQINLSLHLPLFCEGLCIAEEPYCFLSFRGVLDLLSYSTHAKSLTISAFCAQIAASLPRLIFPLKHALNTNNRTIICKVFLLLQKLACIGTGEGGERQGTSVGKLLVQYYRHLLPTVNLILVLHKKSLPFGEFTKTQGRGKHNIVDLALETLDTLANTGGANAKHYIQLAIPTFNYI